MFQVEVKIVSSISRVLHPSFPPWNSFGSSLHPNSVGKFFMKICLPNKYSYSHLPLPLQVKSSKFVIDCGVRTIQNDSTKLFFSVSIFLLFLPPTHDRKGRWLFKKWSKHFSQLTSSKYLQILIIFTKENPRKLSATESLISANLTSSNTILSLTC